jgi:hypothetical protein
MVAALITPEELRRIPKQLRRIAEARCAHECWHQELAPQGFKLRAQILNFAGGMPGDVMIFRRW